MSSAAKKRQEAGLLTAVGVASAAASFLVLPTWAGFVTVGLFLLLVGWLWNPARRHRPMLYVGGVILIVVGAAWWGNDHGKRHSSSSPDFEALAASINHAIRAGRSSPGSPDAIGNIRASVADYVNGARLVLGRAALETSQENEDIAQRVAQFAAVRQKLVHPSIVVLTKQLRVPSGDEGGFGRSWEEILQELTGSAPQYALMVNPRYTRIGIGVAFDSKRQVWLKMVYSSG